MLESSESLDNAGVSVAFSVWESDERLSHTPMDPRSLTHACAVQQGSIASGCCWRNHGQCSVKSSPPNSPHVAVKMSKRCFSKKKGRMREKSHRGSWDPDSQDTTRVASQFGFVGAVAASAHCSLRLLSVLAYIYIYVCVMSRLWILFI